MNLIVLRSPDVERAVAFYQTLGLLFTKHRHGSGPEHYASSAGAVAFEIYPLESRQPTTSARIGFSVADVDSLVRRLVEIEGILVARPADSQWGRRAVIKDLDGHTVELLTPPNRD